MVILVLHNVQGEYYSSTDMQVWPGPLHTLGMAHPKKTAKAPVYFREWRKHRGLTQIRAAEVSGLGQSTITKLENRRIGYTEGNLESLAHAYRCEVADLFRPPGYQENELAAYVMKMGEKQRRKALATLKVIYSQDDEESEKAG